MSPEKFVVKKIHDFYCRMHTATVPKIAPLAPTEGTPTKEKFPPRTLLRDEAVLET